MANAKSVVDIEINDEKFKRYQELFTKYQEALKTTPGAWSKVSEAQDEAASSFEKILAAQMAQKDLERIMAEEHEHATREIRSQSKLWDSIQQRTTGILKDVASIAKWLTVGFGLGGLSLSILTPLGLRAAAEGIADERNQALGLDLKIGETRAFGVTAGRYFSDQGQALLQGAFSAKSDVRSAGYATLAALGISPNQGTVAIADQLLLALQQRAKGASTQQQLGNLLAEYPGLSSFGISLENLQQLKKISTQELQGQVAAFGPTAKRFELSDAQGKQYQDFLSSVDTTWGTVVRQIEKDLVPLLDPMQKFLRALGDDIGIFLKSGAAQKAMDALAAALNRFATYVGSKEFQQDVDGFLNNVDKINRIFHPISTISSNLPGIPAALSAWEAGIRWGQGGAEVAKRFGIPEGYLQGQVLGGNLGSSPKAIAEEDRQILDELKAAGVPTRDQFNQLTKILNMRQAGDFYRMSSRDDVYRNGAESAAATAEKRYINGLRVTVQNNTGGNANVTVAAMGGGTQ